MANAISEMPGCRWHDKNFVSRVYAIRDKGIEIFGPTNLILSGDIGYKEVKAARNFFLVTEPDTSVYPTLANWTKRGGLVEHTDFAAAIAFNLADAVNRSVGARLNPHAHEAALKLHDLGRATTHAFMETDVMTDHLWQMIGLRPDLHRLTHSAHLYWDEVEVPPDKLTIPQKISVVADTAGKRSAIDADRLRLVGEIIPAVKEGKKKYIDKLNPSFYERQMVEKLPEYSRREEQVIGYTLWWFNHVGINLDAIIQAIPIERLS